LEATTACSTISKRGGIANIGGALDSSIDAFLANEKTVRTIFVHEVLAHEMLWKICNGEPGGAS
jgi:hypothetical protein